MTYLMHVCDRSRALPSCIDASVQTTVVWALDPAASLQWVMILIEYTYAHRCGEPSQGTKILVLDR